MQWLQKRFACDRWADREFGTDTVPYPIVELSPLEASMVVNLAYRYRNRQGWRALLLLCAVAVLLVCTSCSTEIDSETSAPIETSAPETSIPATTPPQEPMAMTADTESAILQAASELLQVEQSQLAIAEATPRDWPDGCLGLGGPDEVCTLAIVPGWEVTVSDGQQEWVLRSDLAGVQVRLQLVAGFAPDVNLSESL